MYKILNTDNKNLLFYAISSRNTPLRIYEGIKQLKKYFKIPTVIVVANAEQFSRYQYWLALKLFYSDYFNQQVIDLYTLLESNQFKKDNKLIKDVHNDSYTVL